MASNNILKPIVLVEDNPNDLELTLLALEKARLANEVITRREGAEAIEYLTCQGTWAVLNEPPPGSVRPSQ